MGRLFSPCFSEIRVLKSNWKRAAFVMNNDEFWHLRNLGVDKHEYSGVASSVRMLRQRLPALERGKAI